MGEGAARRGSGGRHPWPCPGTRQVHPPRWTLGTYASSEVGREVGRALARRHRTVQNIWKKRLRISGTHKGGSWLGHYRENGRGRTRSLGRISQMSKSEARVKLDAIVAPLNGSKAEPSGGWTFQS